jgi:hypothetical protein
MSVGDAGKRQAEAQRAAGRLHDAGTGPEFTAFARATDHVEGWAVLDAAGVGPLELGPVAPSAGGKRLVDEHDRGVADGRDEASRHVGGGRA